MWWYVARGKPPPVNAADESRTLYRALRSVWVLSLPFVLYGTAFFLIGMAPFVSGYEGKKWIQNVAIACYATASSSGSLFFALNFGDQGGAP